MGTGNLLFCLKKGDYFQQLDEMCYRNASDSTTGRQPDTYKGRAIMHFRAKLKLSYFDPIGHVKTNTTSTYSEVGGE